MTSRIFFTSKIHSTMWEKPPWMHLYCSNNTVCLLNTTKNSTRSMDSNYGLSTVVYVCSDSFYRSLALGSFTSMMCEHLKKVLYIVNTPKSDGKSNGFVCCITQSSCPTYEPKTFNPHIQCFRMYSFKSYIWRYKSTMYAHG